MTSPGSTRHDGDSWDLTSSVGATATMVAAARAMASRVEQPLINDPFAEQLVAAVGVDLLTRLASGQTRADDLDDDPGRPYGAIARMADNMAVRTKFFDEFFLDATTAGIRQVVILASGLDSRAYRLPWPPGTVVYEIDQPQVIEFKSRTLDELGASPTADRRVVAVDLREDWPAALGAAGFDSTQPTAWSAEGLLGYLTPQAQDHLLDTVTGLSSPGSRFATESLTKIDPDDEDRLKERMQQISERWRQHGFDIDMTALVYFGDRNEAAPYLANHGWLTTSITGGELRAANGLPQVDDEDIPSAEMLYASATLYATPRNQPVVTRAGSVRSDSDSWDLASSVGATATMVAAGRAMATKDPRGLINDPFAEPLVRAVGMDFFTKMINGELELDAIPDISPVRAQAMTDGMAVRTKYFDDYFLRATDSGVRQAVILAAGLDARAYRLPWPAGTVVYELDQPQVIAFKTTTLAGIGAEPTATRRTIGIDLRSDWPSALQAAGLDTTAPTAWLTEGLLIYLPPEAQDRLFDNITALSAAGSTIATEFVPGIVDFDADRVRAWTGSLRDRGIDIDMAALVYAGERNHAVDYLHTKGWDVAGVTRSELFQRNAIDLPAAEDDDPLGEIIFISGALTGQPDD